MKAKWESGSFFHLDVSAFAGESWLPASHQRYGSGRDALKALVAHGVSLGWKRLFVPSYYCHEVTESVRSLISIELYHCNFLSESLRLNLDDHDAIIVVEYFGKRSVVEVTGGVLILDVTHDPCSGWPYKRSPDYIFASLRKTCFLPDGGILWSPVGVLLPSIPSVTVAHARLSELMLNAMTLKAIYLSGGLIEKPVFLDMYRQAEAECGQGDCPSAMSIFSNVLLPSFGMKRVRHARAENVRFLRDRLKVVLRDIEIIESDVYFIMLLTDADQRNFFRDRLIERSVFPIALWPLVGNEIPQEDSVLSEKVLMVHCDARYTLKDMEMIAEAIQQAMDVLHEC